jgi:hypothetical protein
MSQENQRIDESVTRHTKIMSATLRNPLIVVEKAWKEEVPKQELTAYVKVSNSNEKKKVVNSELYSYR